MPARGSGVRQARPEANAKRRENEEGTIGQNKDGRWCPRLTGQDGRGRAFYGKTREEVARKLAAAVSDRDRGLPVLRAGPTLDKVLGDWWETVVRPSGCSVLCVA